MSNYEATRYDYDGSNITGIEGVPTATIIPWSDSSLPSGFLECNGQAVSRTTYAALFAIVATTYGSGNGSTTFNVPDFKDNIPLGRSNSKALASTGGANTVASTGNIAGSTANHTLTTPELASHSHTLASKDGPGAASNVEMPFNNKQANNGGTTGSTGGGGGHSHNMSANFSGDATSVLQPYLTTIYIIKT
jgi:microcystin-dependent protein|tara:strand:+ start:4485 stop:5060 length:576 start_codon:yes stop_codon:yes gene_type:complete